MRALLLPFGMSLKVCQRLIFLIMFDDWTLFFKKNNARDSFPPSISLNLFYSKGLKKHNGPR